MRFRGHLKEAVANLLTSKLRSFLTVLGVLVGTASVVALVSGGRLATEHALAQFKMLGTDLLAVNIEEARNEGGGEGNAAQILRLQDIKTVLRSIPDLTDAAPYTMMFESLSYDGAPLQGNIIGATRSLKDIVKIELAQGRFVSSYDDQEMFCLIGAQLAKKLKQLGVINPIGKQIKMGDYYFVIVGVAKPWIENIFMYSNINESIIIPIETSLLLSKHTRIRNVVFRIAPKTDIPAVQHDIQTAINRITPGKKIFFRSAQELVSSMEKQREALTLFLVLIGGVSLVVGGIGVMNIMLVSVIERRREIGIRMAVGARQKDIQLMFITEAIVLTIFGGVLGIVIGEVISFLTAFFSGWTFYFYLFPPMAGFVVSVLVGMFFGFYPAYSASQLDPIETLRSE